MPGLPRYSHKLEALAAPLRPERPPFYVRHPVSGGLERDFPVPGWYWVPSGAAVVDFLAYGYELAAHRLRNLIEREDESL